MDTECRQYRPCRLPGLPFMSCPQNLVFNRNTGTCDYESRAPCTPFISTPDCPRDGVGFFPGKTCYKYMFCNNGELFGEWTCIHGWHFDADRGECVEDYYGVCHRYFEGSRVKNGKRNVEIKSIE